MKNLRRPALKRSFQAVKKKMTLFSKLRCVLLSL